MSNSYSIAEAKNSLSRLVHDAESGEPVVLTRHGREVAVILSMDTYRARQGKGPDLWERIQEFRATHDLEALAIDPDEIFERHKDRSPGRDIRL